MQDEQICPLCNETIINVWRVGWAHKNIYSTCTLKDGLTLVEIEKDLYQYEIIDTNSRLFFIRKFDELFEQQKSGLKEQKSVQKPSLNAEFTENSQKTPLNDENLLILPDVILRVSAQKIIPLKKKNIGFEIYE